MKRLLARADACLAGAARAQPAPDPAHPGTFLLTIFLRHDETKTLGEINEHCGRRLVCFPPPGVESCHGT